MDFVFINRKNGELLTIVNSDNTDNISEEDYDEGYNMYLLPDLYKLPENFEPAKLPEYIVSSELTLQDGTEPELIANLTQALYKSEEVPWMDAHTALSKVDSLDGVGTEADGWELVKTC